MTTAWIVEPVAPPRPTAEDLAFFDHRFRFMERNNPVAEELYSLALQWSLENGYTMPPAGTETAGTGIDPLDPLDIVQLEVRLPPLPAVMFKLQEVLQRRHFSSEQVASVIAQDPGLTAWLLKLVNSPYYGFSAKISTISRAVALVGTRQIQTLAVGGALGALAVLLPKGLLDMERFWRHSVAVGIVSQEIWKHSGRPDGEQLFVSGILHDCGQLALAHTAKRVITALNKTYGHHAGPTYIMEQALVGFDHARLGGMLLHRWNMPLPLVIAVLRHHHVEEPSRYPEAAVIHVADILVTALGITTRPMPPVPPLSLEAWNVLGITPESLAEVTAVLKNKLDDICRALRT